MSIFISIEEARRIFPLGVISLPKSTISYEIFQLAEPNYRALSSIVADRTSRDIAIILWLEGPWILADSKDNNKKTEITTYLSDQVRQIIAELYTKQYNIESLKQIVTRLIEKKDEICEILNP